MSIDLPHDPGSDRRALFLPRNRAGQGRAGRGSQLGSQLARPPLVYGPSAALLLAKIEDKEAWQETARGKAV